MHLSWILVDAASSLQLEPRTTDRRTSVGSALPAQQSTAQHSTVKYRTIILTISLYNDMIHNMDTTTETELSQAELDEIERFLTEHDAA